MRAVPTEIIISLMPGNWTVMDRGKAWLTLSIAWQHAEGIRTMIHAQRNPQTWYSFLQRTDKKVGTSQVGEKVSEKEYNGDF